MLINTAAKRPSLAAVRRIKRTLHRALALPDTATLTVTQLACREAGCAPLETVIGLLRPGCPPLQHRLHKATDAIDADDLVAVCSAWGLSAPRTVLHTGLQET